FCTAPSLLHCSSRSLSSFFFHSSASPRDLHSFPTRRSSDLPRDLRASVLVERIAAVRRGQLRSSTCRADRTRTIDAAPRRKGDRSEEHTSELQSRENLVCRLLLEIKKKQKSKGVDKEVTEYR